MTILPKKDANCYVCGAENKLGLQVPFSRQSGGGSRAFYTARSEHTGGKGMLHGGVTFALMDEALGWALYYQNLRGVTARTEVRFRLPILEGTPVVITGCVVERVRRIVRARAEVRRDGDDGGLLAELEATMCLLADDSRGDE